MENILSKIDVKTFKRIQKVIFSAYPIGIIANAFTLDNSFIYWTLLASFYLNSFLSFTDMDTKTKEYQEMKSLYQKFLTNYQKLNEYFHFTNPIEIFTLYEVLLFNGYLSQNKKFIGENLAFKEIKPFAALEIFNGFGVCRHTSLMLKDILNKSQMPTHFLGCNMTDVEDDGIRKWMSSISGNHAICYTKYAGKDYFLDSINSTFWHLKDNLILTNPLCGDMEIKMSIIANHAKDNKEIKGWLKENNTQISFKEQMAIMEETSERCLKETSLYEDFYLENKPIYEEVLKKLELVKKYRFF